MANPNLRSNTSIIHSVGAIALLLVLALLIYTAATNGYAAKLTARASSNNDLDAAAAAVRLSPRNAETHLLFGALLEANNERSSAITQYRTAIEARPQDYVLWLQLARALELERDIDGALSAGRNAVGLAPFYAQPHWQLGNMLVRAGQRAEGFQELRLASAADPTLQPAIIDLAWQMSGGDVEFVKQAIRPETTQSHIALGNYFKQRGDAPAALAMFIAAGTNAEAALARRQYLSELITAGDFKAAYQLWTVDHKSDAGQSPGTIINPRFSAERDLDEPGFDWRRLNPSPALALTLDSDVPQDSPSLRVDFQGASEPGLPIIAQLVSLAPNTHYQLHFTYTSEALVSGGLPRVTIVDAGNTHLLGQSKALSAPVWTDTDIDFNTEAGTVAIRIALEREPCGNSACPIFGRLWLDGFELKESRRQ